MGKVTKVTIYEFKWTEKRDIIIFFYFLAVFPINWPYFTISQVTFKNADQTLIRKSADQGQSSQTQSYSGQSIQGEFGKRLTDLKLEVEGQIKLAEKTIYRLCWSGRTVEVSHGATMLKSANCKGLPKTFFWNIGRPIRSAIWSLIFSNCLNNIKSFII